MNNDHMELPLPRLVGSRLAARELAQDLGDVTARTVVLNARELRAASPSSADELVKVFLVEGGAARLEVLSGTSDFIKDVEEAASDHGVSDRIAVATAH